MRPVRAVVAVVAVLAATVVSVVTPSPAAASFAGRVSVTSHELHGGPECLDRTWGVFCPRPDLFARAIINMADGTRVCPTGPVTDDFENVVADQALCINVYVKGDFTVTFELWDSDEDDAPGASQQGDLAAGDAKGWTTPRFTGGVEGTQRFTTSGGPSTAVFSVLIRPVTTTITVTEPVAAGTDFDPSLGERAWIRGMLNDPARLRFVISVSATGESFELVTGPFWGGTFNIDWDGRRTPGAGPVLPVGDYTVTISDVSHANPATRPSVSRPIRIVRRASSLLAITGARPAATWDVASGPITVDAITGQGGSFWVEVAPRSPAGPCGPTLARTPEQQRGAGQLELGWDGKAADQSLATPGEYCLRLFGRATSGGALGPSTPFVVTVAPRTVGLEAYALLNPAVPAALPTAGGGRIQIVAEALRAKHSGRYAASITIEATAARTPGASMAAAPRVLRRCERVTSCIVDLPPDLAAAEAVAYRVSAAERADLADAATFAGTWRITDLHPLPNRVWRVSSPAVVTTMVSGTPVTSQINVVYYPGTGYDLTNTVAATDFAATVGDNVWQLLGAGPRARFPSSVAAGWDAVSVHVANIPVAVSHTDGTMPGSAEDLCEWPGFPTVSFGEVHGVPHRVDCRDNAGNGVFTANDPQIGWHEFHHAAYAEE
ncbi:hypothetical protein, partial [Asanoa ferruginea]